MYVAAELSIFASPAAVRPLTNELMLSGTTIVIESQFSNGMSTARYPFPAVYWNSSSVAIVGTETLDPSARVKGNDLVRVGSNRSTQPALR